MQSEFKSIGFSLCLYAKDRRSIADAFSRKNRCGIYILHFENGDYYVGQAVDVVRRYAQHRLNYTDIAYVSFKQVAQSKLSLSEKLVVWELENHKKTLRNISLVSIVMGETDLDFVVSKEDQERWTRYELDIDTLQSLRFNYPELRNRYSLKFHQLEKSKYYDQICEILNDYILNTIPYPCKTEYSFWSCTCLPGARGLVFSRVNIYWQEVLTLCEDLFLEKGKKQPVSDLAVSFHLCKSVLFNSYTKAQLKEKFHSIDFTEHKYVPGGQDQQNVIIHYSDFYRFINDRSVLDAIKEFNLRLMRKGACIYNRYHCFGLADQALRSDAVESVALT